MPTTYFRESFSVGLRRAKDILRLALTAEECDLFDLDKMTVDKDSTLNPSTNQEGYGDLHFKLPLKDYLQCQVHFGVFFEHKTSGANQAIKQLRKYCLREMDRTEGLVFGVVVNQGLSKITTPDNYLDYLLKNKVPPEIIAKLARIFGNFYIKSVDLPALQPEQLRRPEITSAACLLAMKYIRKLTHQVMTMVFGALYLLTAGDRKTLSSMLMSYICRADKKYDRQGLAAIEADSFPNVEVKIMEEIRLGFEEADYQGFQRGRAEGVEQGIEQVAIRLLESGELSEDGICAVANISKKKLAEIKRKIHVTRGSL